jgi:hypothetical protein
MVLLGIVRAAGRYRGARHFVSPSVAAFLADPSAVKHTYNRRDDLHSWLRVCIIGDGCGARISDTLDAIDAKHRDEPNGEWL